MKRRLACLVLSLATPVVLCAQTDLDERPARAGEWGFRPAAGTTVDRNPPPLTWRPQKGARRYEVELARDDEFTRPIRRETRYNVWAHDTVLDAGTWHWRFRVKAPDTSTPWSRIRSFSISPEALPFPRPRNLIKRIPGAHPRLFVRPEQRGALERAAAATLLARCDRLLEDPPSLAEPPLYPPDTKRGSDAWRALWWGNRKHTIRALSASADLAFAGWLTGEKKYLVEARRILMACAGWNPKGSTGYRYNDEAGMPYAYWFSRTYTFLHHALSEEERRICRDVMRVRGREMYAHLHPRHLWRPYNSHANRAWHFLGEVGIAFLDEIPEASHWVDFAVTVFYTVYPVWSDDDGGWHEGTTYWNSYLSRFTWWADVMKAAMNVDAFALPYFKRCGDWFMTVMPPNAPAGGFGDLTPNMRPERARGLMTTLALQANDPHWQWYVEQIGGPLHGNDFIGYLRSSRPVPKAKAPTDLPASRIFRGTGIAVLNTNILDARKNVQVMFKSSPFGSQSHGYEAQNSLLVYPYGERWLIRSGRRDSYGSNHHKNWMWETRSVNSMTIGGRGQRRHSASARGRITSFETSEHVDWVEGEAGGAYPGGVREFRRGILFVKPDLIFVRDVIDLEKPSTIAWHYHAPLEGFTGLGAWSHELGERTCTVGMIAPLTPEITVTDRFSPPPRPRVKLKEHHATFRTEAREGRSIALTVIDVDSKLGYRSDGVGVVFMERDLKVAVDEHGTVELTMDGKRRTFPAR